MAEHKKNPVEGSAHGGRLGPESGPGWTAMNAASASDEPRILDLDHLARQTCGDGELERELLALFEQQCGRLLPLLGGESSAPERSDAVHTPKGAARAVGAWRIAALAEEVEHALRAGEACDRVRRLAGELDQAIRDTRAAIARLGESS